MASRGAAGQAPGPSPIGRTAEGEWPPSEETFGRRSQWERIALGPNVELQVRRPLSRAENRAVERLLDAARALFEEKPEEES